MTFVEPDFNEEVLTRQTLRGSADYYHYYYDYYCYYSGVGIHT